MAIVVSDETLRKLKGKKEQKPIVEEEPKPKKGKRKRLALDFNAPEDHEDTLHPSELKGIIGSGADF